VSAAAASVAAFLEGTVVYALSQQWDDLLSIYWLRLHPVPYCGGATTGLECTPEAPASRQLGYAIHLALVAALLQAFAEYGPLPYRWHAWRLVAMRVGPRMIGMCLGWALGNAAKAGLLTSDEWRGSGRIACSARGPRHNSTAAATVDELR
jgi:hypothetical protein